MAAFLISVKWPVKVSWKQILQLQHQHEGLVSVRQCGLSGSSFIFLSLLCPSDQQNVPEEDSFASDLSLSSPMKKVEFNLDLDLIGADPDMEKQTTDQTTDNGNENNNNDMNTGVYKQEASLLS